MPPSLNKENPIVPTLPESVTHIYARQHNTKGLAPSFLGPFPVISRPSRSTIEIQVGLNAQGIPRKEIRHISDIKVAYLREDATIAERPKRGRPRKQSPPEQTPTPSSNPSTAETDTSTDQNNNAKSTEEETRNLSQVAAINLDPGNSNFVTTSAEPFRNSITGPPPRLGFPLPKTWSASSYDLDIINRSISGS